MSTIKVEFFGLPRQRAGVAETTARGATLGEVLADVARRYPDFAADCVENGRLRADFVANLDGRQFVRSPDTRLDDSESILILSADAGG